MTFLYPRRAVPNREECRWLQIWDSRISAIASRVWEYAKLSSLGRPRTTIPVGASASNAACSPRCSGDRFGRDPCPGRGRPCGRRRSARNIELAAGARDSSRLGSGSIRAAFKPVSPCNFGKCREILTKCRDEASAARLKTVRCHKLGRHSPYLRSREAMLL